MTPTFVSESVEIHARPQVVWLVFSEIDKWPAWNPICVEAISLDEEPWRAEGRFDFTLATEERTYALTAKVVQAIPGRMVRWLCGWRGMAGDFEFSFEPFDGRTRVSASEQRSGFVSSFLRLGIPPYQAEKLLRVWLESLGREAERRARELREVV
ncbi:MAG: SRPBCC family protein [Actinobacteria bacterium]|nr:SRPBCC family protein [Actinomycetota bacterium]